MPIPAAVNENGDRMIAAGIDLGGTKIELQMFGEDWDVVERRRVPTPKNYEELVAALASLIAWVDEKSGQGTPVGIGAAGLLNPATGLALTANLCASGRPLHRDLTEAVGREITYVNDCRALALSEAVFGVGRGYKTVMSLILGTGVGGGIAIDGKILSGPSMTGGEFGHISAPAHLIVEHDLPIVRCGCGRLGCVETYIAGPGMSRVAKAIMGEDISPPDIISERETNPKAEKVWQVWCEITADLLRNLILTVDPSIVIIGGGLSNIPEVSQALQEAATRAQFKDYSVPPIVLAQGGDASGARGAAYAAFQAAS